MPVDGFYEWHRIGKENRPYLIRRPMAHDGLRGAVGNLA